MHESTKIILLASAIYLIMAVTCYLYGYGYDKSKQIYAILAYLVFYQVIVVLVVIEPVSVFSLRIKTIILIFSALVIMGQVYNDSRTLYPFTSWTMYSTPTVTSGNSVMLLNAIEKNGDSHQLIANYFSPARSSRAHSEKFVRIIRERESNSARYKILMQYYCKTLSKRYTEVELIQIVSKEIDQNGINEPVNLLTEYDCIKP